VPVRKVQCTGRKPCDGSWALQGCENSIHGTLLRIHHYSTYAVVPVHTIARKKRVYVLGVAHARPDYCH
jgi:hypothetical protein